MYHSWLCFCSVKLISKDIRMKVNSVRIFIWIMVVLYLGKQYYTHKQQYNNWNTVVWFWCCSCVIPFVPILIFLTPFQEKKGCCRIFKKIFNGCRVDLINKFMAILTSFQLTLNHSTYFNRDKFQTFIYILQIIYH